VGPKQGHWDAARVVKKKWLRSYFWPKSSDSCQCFTFDIFLSPSSLLAFQCDSSTFECFFPNKDTFASLYTTKIWMFNWFQGKMSRCRISILKNLKVRVGFQCSGGQDVDILVLAHKRGHDEGPPRCGDLKWPSMGPIKCFSVCSYRKILEWRLFKSFYVKTFNTSWPAVCRMGCNYILSCPTHALADGVNHISLFWVFSWQCDHLSIPDAPRLPNMVSALILVLLWKWNQIVVKQSWDSKSPKQWIQVWLMIITDFLSPMDCFTSSYPYLFTWNVTLYKILLW